ncbi:MAG TPA: hypothetical protein VF322_10610 [Gammaproteobacteria bacterium]
MHVASMVVERSLVLAGIGVAAGVALALAASRLMSSLLYGIAPTIPSRTPRARPCCSSPPW